MPRPPKYGPEEREEALRLYVSEGLAAAVERTGVKKSTVWTWAREAGLRPSSGVSERSETKKAQTATETRAAILDERRWRETGAALTAAERFREKALRAPDAASAQKLAVAYGIMVDKAEKLADAVTAPPPTPLGDATAEQLAAAELPAEGTPEFEAEVAKWARQLGFGAEDYGGEPLT